MLKGFKTRTKGKNMTTWEQLNPGKKPRKPKKRERIEFFVDYLELFVEVILHPEQEQFTVKVMTDDQKKIIQEKTYFSGKFLEDENKEYGFRLFSTGDFYLIFSSIELGPLIKLEFLDGEFNIVLANI